MTYDPQSSKRGFSDYRSHRVVRAAKILASYHGQVRIEPVGDLISFDTKGKPTPQVGWYVLCYDDGYISFCPPEQFEKGYSRCEAV